MVFAMSPISSPRDAPGMVTARSPAAIFAIAPLSRVIGRAMPAKENSAEPISTMTIAAPKPNPIRPAHCIVSLASALAAAIDTCSV